MAKIKKIFKDKKVLLIIGSVALNLILIAALLLCDCDTPKRGRRGYQPGWYGRDKMVEKGVFKSHTGQMQKLHQKAMEILSADELDVNALRATFAEINAERGNFTKIAEDNMVEKFSKMSQKERQKFVRKMYRGHGMSFGRGRDGKGHRREMNKGKFEKNKFRHKGEKGDFKKRMKNESAKAQAQEN